MYIMHNTNTYTSGRAAAGRVRDTGARRRFGGPSLRARPMCPFVTPCVDRSAGHSVRTKKKARPTTCPANRILGRGGCSGRGVAVDGGCTM